MAIWQSRGYLVVGCLPLAAMSFTTSDVSKLHGWLKHRRNGGEKDTVSDH